MNFVVRQSLNIFFAGVFVLLIAIVMFYKLNYNSNLNHQLEDSNIFVEKISKGINQHIIEKVKKVKIIVVAPVITNALYKSNKHYKTLSKKNRDEEILQKNNKWKSIKDQNNAFILDYTNNEVSEYLKDIQHNIKGEYGEIFLTNKYGALVASTAKLSTFAHDHKYWWQGAYNNGNGAVFLDDRGYDDSVDGYVLGVVVPIKKDGEIIGILKANLNILGSINTIIVNHQIKNHEKLKLIRSGGLIVFEEGLEPLSNRISNDLQKKIQAKPNESFVFETEGDKFIVGCAEIKISSKMEAYNFGGDFESIDHNNGNSGESWLILDFNPFSNVIKQITEIVYGLWFIGILLAIIFAITSFIIGKRTAKPLRQLIIQTKQITKGDYNLDIVTNRKDEIGELAISFNQMTNYLKESTTSIENLNLVNQQLTANEQQLRATNQQLISKTKKLKESENKFLTWISNSPVCTKVVDLDFNLQFMSESGVKELGIDDINKFYGKPYPLYFYPDSFKTSMIHNLKKVKETGEIVIQEAPLQDIEGNLIWYHSTIIPVNDENGKLDYFLVVSKETTKRMQAEDKIKEKSKELEKQFQKSEEQRIATLSVLSDLNESTKNLKLEISERKRAEKELIKLSTAVKQSPSVIAITDTKGDLEYINPKFTELTGYTFDEALNENTKILKSGKMPEEVYDKLWKTISSGKEWRGEFHNKKKNGELFWESASVSPIFDEHGRIINYLKVAENITERKRASQIQKVLYNISNAVITTENFDELIKRIREELGAIIDTTNFYIALYDKKTDTISLPYFKDEKDVFTSFPAGKTLTNYVIKTHKSLFATKEEINKLENLGDVEIFGENSKIWLGVPLKIEGEVTGVIAVQSYTDENVYDESDKEILEFVSHHISISIERKKAEEDLKLALEKAQESDRLKSAFLTNMSHEIRTPMNGILGFTGLLKEPHLTGDEKNSFIRIIERSGNRMLSTINDIVDISRIEAGQVDVINTKVSLNKIFEEQYNFFNREAEAKGLELVSKFTISDKEANIITDKHKLEGILTNLIKNAIKFTDHGHIIFGCSIKKEKDADVLAFYVKDTGIGIPSDRIEAIFNRFEQADIEDVRVYEDSMHLAKHERK